MSHKPGGRLPLLSARPAVTPQPLRGLLPVLLLGEQRHSGCEQFASKTVTRQRRDCDLNSGPSAPESSTLTARLPSHRITGSGQKSVESVLGVEEEVFTVGTTSDKVRFEPGVSGRQRELRIV